jgi:preprotein translocase subunit SecD
MRKTILIVAVSLGGFFVLLLGAFLLFGPSYFRERLYFGLGFRPKTELVLQVQVQDVVKEEADDTIDRLQEELSKAGLTGLAIERNDPARTEDAERIQIDVRGIPVDKAGLVRSLVSERFSAWVLTPGEGSSFRMNLRPAELVALKQDAVERSIQVIQKRIRGLGLIARVFRREGSGSPSAEIVVQWASRLADPARVYSFLRTVARLELTAVKDGPFASRDQAMAKLGGVLPPGTRLLRVAARGPAEENWYLLSRRPVIAGQHLQYARPGRDEAGRWETDFTLSQPGAELFARFTEANIGNRLAIVLDNQVWSAPTIQGRIENQGRITGLFSQQEAFDLAMVLRSGALPAGVVLIEERNLEP